MKTFIYLLSILGILVLVDQCTSEEEMYSTKYDNVDIESILKNKRMKKAYVDCFMDRGKCLEDGQFIKERVHDALETKCSKCSPKQLELIERVGKYYIENDKDTLRELQSKYDPDKKYYAGLYEEAKKRGYDMPAPSEL